MRLKNICFSTHLIYVKISSFRGRCPLWSTAGNLELFCFCSHFATSDSRSCKDIYKRISFDIIRNTDYCVRQVSQYFKIAPGYHHSLTSLAQNTLTNSQCCLSRSNVIWQIFTRNCVISEYVTNIVIVATTGIARIFVCGKGQMEQSCDVNSVT